jgi:hypothetical protein
MDKVSLEVNFLEDLSMRKFSKPHLPLLGLFKKKRWQSSLFGLSLPFVTNIMTSLIKNKIQKK